MTRNGKIARLPRAIRDELTGVLNRRGFSEVAKIELSRAHRYNRPVGMILIDLDHLKQVNDTYGHTAGDLAIKEIANTCIRNIRVVDYLGRWGGDEFIILLPESNQESTIIVAERVQTSIAALSIAVEDKLIALTISAGVAVEDKTKLSFNELFSHCDSALYSAKQAGRNGFVFFQ